MRFEAAAPARSDVGHQPVQNNTSARSLLNRAAPPTRCRAPGCHCTGFVWDPVNAVQHYANLTWANVRGVEKRVWHVHEDHEENNKNSTAFRNCTCHHHYSMHKGMAVVPVVKDAVHI
eukprot:tig00020629_g12360.t1